MTFLKHGIVRRYNGIDLLNIFVPARLYQECVKQRWIDKHRPTLSSTSSLAHTTFLPLQVGDDFSLPSAPKIEVITKTGLTLRFPVSTPSETLLGIIRQLDIPC